MSLLVVLFLIAVAAVGYLATLAAGVPLRAEERFVAGVAVGTVIVSSVGFVVAWVIGMGGLAVAVATFISLLALAPPSLARGFEMLDEIRDLRRRLTSPWRDPEHPWPLMAITLVSAVVSGRILALAYGSTPQGGVTVGHLSTYGDWSAHLSYTASFAYADNWPPDLPTAAGESFAYHFGVDWFAAMFVPLGSSLQGSLQISAWFLAAAFPGILYMSGRRFVASRAGAALGVLLFLASGGTAALWRFLFEDLPEGGIGVLGALPRTYAFDGFDRNWVDNAVTGFLYPQRPTLVGFAVTALLLAILWEARDRSDSHSHLFAGLLVAVMPIFHVFSYAVIMVMAVGWAVLERSRRWLTFLAPAALGLLLVWWEWPEAGGRTLHLFWVVGLDNSSSTWSLTFADFLWFWLLNTGVFIPLAAYAFWRLDRVRLVHFLPLWGLLLLPNVAIWHFWEGNNAKYLMFFLLLAAPFVGEELVRWSRFAATGLAVSVLVVVSLTLSGGLDIWRAFEGTTGSSGRAAAYPVGYMSPDDVLVGEWVRDNTAPDAVFATAGDNVHPVRAIAGRTVVSGSAGRLRDLGVDWWQRLQDLGLLYGVYEGYDGVIASYGVDYLVLGDPERRAFRPPDAAPDWDPAIFWDAAAPIVYDIGGYRIYDVSGFK